jgi:hypothetical protein
MNEVEIKEKEIIAYAKHYYNGYIGIRELFPETYYIDVAKCKREVISLFVDESNVLYVGTDDGNFIYRARPLNEMIIIENLFDKVRKNRKDYIPYHTLSDIIKTMKPGDYIKVMGVGECGGCCDCVFAELKGQTACRHCKTRIGEEGEETYFQIHRM